MLQIYAARFSGVIGGNSIMKKFGLAAVTTLALASASYLALAGSSYAADMMLKSPAMEAAQPVSGYIELYSGWGNTAIKGDEGYRFGLDGWMAGRWAERPAAPTGGRITPACSSMCRAKAPVSAMA